MPIRTVICGSYHKDPAELSRLYRELVRAGCQVLSPFRPDFIDHNAAFVANPADHFLEPAELERRHLAALANADCVWLHAPNGYLGVSGSFELGFAVALRKKIFAQQATNEPTFNPFITLYPSVFSALETEGLLTE